MIIGDLLKIIAEILPLLTKDEAEKVQAKIDKLKKEWEGDYEKILKALESNDIPALNLLISHLLDAGDLSS